MHITTRALVLREVNYKESDKILTLLTEDEGKLTANARGCRKKGGSTAAACQQLVWSEFTLYERLGQWNVKEAVAERRFEGVRSDLFKLSLGSYFAEVADALAGEGEVQRELLSLVLNSLYALEALPLPLMQVKAGFEWRAMAQEGYAPLVDACAVCGRRDVEQPRIRLAEGVVHCAACASEDGSLPLTDGALAALRHIVTGDPRRLFSFRLDEQSLRGLSAAGEAYLRFHLDRGFRTLDFYQQLCGGTDGQKAED